MLNNIIVPFKTARALKQTYVIMKKNKKNLNYIKLFWKLGIIGTYSCFKKKMKINFLFKNHLLALQGFRVFKSKTSQFIISRKSLNKMLTNGNFFILLENSLVRKDWLNRHSTQGGRILAVVHN